MARSDGKCGKSANWAPCALVPTLGRDVATPCCNFATNQCLPANQCDCPHCVDYAQINQATLEIKQTLAANNYANNIAGKVKSKFKIFV